MVQALNELLKLLFVPLRPPARLRGAGSSPSVLSTASSLLVVPVVIIVASIRSFYRTR